MESQIFLQFLKNNRNVVSSWASFVEQAIAELFSSVFLFILPEKWLLFIHVISPVLYSRIRSNVFFFFTRLSYDSELNSSLGGPAFVPEESSPRRAVSPVLQFRIMSKMFFIRLSYNSELKLPSRRTWFCIGIALYKTRCQSNSSL